MSLYLYLYLNPIGTLAYKKQMPIISLHKWEFNNIQIINPRHTLTQNDNAQMSSVFSEHTQYYNKTKHTIQTIWDTIKLFPSCRANVRPLRICNFLVFLEGITGLTSRSPQQPAGWIYHSFYTFVNIVSGIYIYKYVPCITIYIHHIL